MLSRGDCGDRLGVESGPKDDSGYSCRLCGRCGCNKLGDVCDCGSGRLGVEFDGRMCGKPGDWCGCRLDCGCSCGLGSG